MILAGWQGVAVAYGPQLEAEAALLDGAVAATRALVPNVGWCMQQRGAQARAAYARNDMGAAGNTGAGSGTMQVKPLTLFRQAAEHPRDWDSRASEGE